MNQPMIVGANGQLGQELQKYLKELNIPFDALTEKN